MVSSVHAGWRRVATATLGMVMIAACGGCAMFTERDQVYIRGGALMRGNSPLTLRGIEAQALADLDASDGDLVTALNRATACGADAVWFDLPSADNGPAVSQPMHERLRRIVFHGTWRRLGLVCRVAPQGPDAARAIAGALRDDHEFVYWIDADPDTVAAFREAAPRLVVAAEQGGRLQIRREAPQAIADAQTPSPTVYVLESAEEAVTAGAHFLIVGDDDATRAALDSVMADPAERTEWTPDNAALSDEERADGWLALFNGRNLDGWILTGANKDGFAAEDGMIVWKGRGGGVLQTQRRFADFALRFEFRIAEGGNSGVFLRAPRTGRQSKIGMEFQIMGDYGVPAYKNGTGAIYDVVAPAQNASRPAGEWNEAEVELNGAHLRATLNGVRIHDLDLDANEELRYRLREGFICLQDHGSQVAFRNIRIKPL